MLVVSSVFMGGKWEFCFLTPSLSTALAGVCGEKRLLNLSLSGVVLDSSPPHGEGRPVKYRRRAQRRGRTWRTFGTRVCEKWSPNFVYSGGSSLGARLLQVLCWEFAFEEQRMEAEQSHGLCLR